MNKYKKFVSILLVVTVFFCCSVALINYTVDPLWCFSHRVPIGKYQNGFDERQQKTNWLTFHDVSYDTLILGSSRVAYLDPRCVPGKAFNYATSSMKPVEFLEYAEYFKKMNSRPVKIIILGLSFFETNASMENTSPSWYIDRSNSLFFRYTTLFTVSLISSSINAIKRDLKKDIHGAYFYEGMEIFSRQMILPVSPIILEKSIASEIPRYRSDIYGGNYFYDSENKNHYKKLQENFPEARFHVFITPVTYHLLDLLKTEGRWSDYKRWITELVNTFGIVWNFMYYNEVTMNVSPNFQDAHHYSPEIGELIIKKIYKLPIEHHYESFGIKMTPKTLSSDIDFLERNFQTSGLNLTTTY